MYTFKTLKSIKIINNNICKKYVLQRYYFAKKYLRKNVCEKMLAKKCLRKSVCDKLFAKISPPDIGINPGT